MNPFKKIKNLVSGDSDDLDDSLDRDYDNLETDNMRWELAYTDVLEGYEHALRNEKQTVTGKWVQRPGTRPRMNEVGISLFISELHPILNKGTPLGSIDEKFAKEASRTKALYILNKLAKEPEKYGIKNLLEVRSLVIDFYVMCYITLTRPIKGKERSLRSKRMKINENYNHDEVSRDELRGSGGYSL